MSDSRGIVSNSGQSGPPRYLRWLVPLLALLMLLLALLLVGGFRVFVHGGWPTAEASAGAVWQTTLDREAALRRELALLEEQWLGRQAQCPMVAVRPPESGAGSLTPPFPSLPGRKPGGAPISPPSPGPAVEPNPPSPGPVAGGPEGDERPPFPATAPKPPAPSRPDTPLIIPKQTENMEFLNGCWRSITSLFEKRNKKPIEHEYCFDDSGAGEVTVRSRQFVCKGKISAAMQGTKTLVIKTVDQELGCNNGSRFGGWQVVCQSQANGKAVCQGVNYSDKTRFDVTLLRK